MGQVHGIFTIARRYYYLRKAFLYDELPPLSSDADESTRLWHAVETERRAHHRDSYIDPESKSIRLAQWCRFLSAEDSALSTLYNQLLPHRMAYLPFTLLFKPILLCPAIFIDPNTTSQLIGIAVVEGCYAIFLLCTSAYISPFVDLLNRIGSAHQLLMFGFVSWYQIGGPASRWLIGFTSIYLCFACLFVICVALKPVVSAHVGRRHRLRLSISFGLPPATAAPLYVAGVVEDDFIVRDSSSQLTHAGRGARRRCLRRLSNTTTVTRTPTWCPCIGSASSVTRWHPLLTNRHSTTVGLTPRSTPSVFILCST